MCSGRGYWGACEANEEGAEVFVVRSLGRSPLGHWEGKKQEGGRVIHISTLPGRQPPSPSPDGN